MNTEQPELEISAEKETPKQTTENQEITTTEGETENLTLLSPAELCATLASDIENRDIAELKGRVEELKVIFYKKIKADDESARAQFVAQGNAAEEFTATTSPEEIRFKELLSIYRDNRNKHTAQSEEQKEANYKEKLKIIEELKALVDSTETMGVTFASFRELQGRWREIGAVPLGVTKDLWETYHHHTENFYNFVKINKELRDLDLKRNTEIKLDICARAEKLAELSSPITAFGELQKLHDEYREAGPVPAEEREPLWERFKAASAVINKKHQEHYDKIREEQEKNLALKEEICQKTEELLTVEAHNIKEWNDIQAQITEMQGEWKKIGFAPKKDNSAIYDRFRAACDKFFSAKREFFGELKSEMQSNLESKTALCIKAEELSESEEWKATTDKLIELQKEWKAIGAVPRKNSDALWKRFRAACDKFFERKNEHFKEGDNKHNENLEAKRKVLDELRALEGSDDLSFDRLKELMSKFGAAGFVPIKKKEEINKEFKEVCDKLFDTLRSKEGGERIEKFRKKINEAKTSGTGSVVGGEADKLNGKLRALQNELKLLENNIGFFSMSKGAESLIAEVERKIDKTKKEIAEVKEKIKILGE